MLKSKLPSTVSLLKPQVDHNAYKAQGNLKSSHMHATLRIRMGKTWEPATVIAQHTAPRSYVVSTPDGTA